MLKNRLRDSLKRHIPDSVQWGCGICILIRGRRWWGWGGQIGEIGRATLRLPCGHHAQLVTRSHMLVSVSFVSRVLAAAFRTILELG